MAKTKITRVGVIDAETDPFKRYRVPRPFLWGFYDGTEYHEFTETADLVDFIQDFDGLIYAHNGGKFDFHFLLEYLKPYDSIMIINGRIAKMPFGAAELRDSYCLIPVPLGAYKKDEIDYSLFEADERDKPANRVEISKYLKSDCVYLWDLVTAFHSQYGVNLTLAGSAMKVWGKMSSMPLPETDIDFYQKFAPYYSGGRVQCFESGIINDLFSVYDIRSAYPHAMLSKHPYSHNFSETDGYSENADFYAVRCVALGCFPCRDNGIINSPLTFPDDHELRTYYVSKWEFDAAIETLSIYDVDVISSIIFMGHIDFTDYVKYFGNMKNECEAKGDQAGRIFAKLFLNSLYGKFAANPSEYENSIIVPMDVTPGLTLAGWRFAGEFGPWGLAQQPIEPFQMRFYNVATAASITGAVRAKLWRAICDCDGVMYCDTDAIAARKMGESLTLGDKLGDWTNEGEFDKAGISGKKLYIFKKRGKREYKKAHKGAKLTNAQMWKLANKNEVEFIPENPTFSVHKAPVTKAWENAEVAVKMFTKRKIRFTAK